MRERIFAQIRSPNGNFKKNTTWIYAVDLCLLSMRRQTYHARMQCISLIRSDIGAKAQWLYGQNTARTRWQALCTDGTAAMILYRLMQAAQRSGIPPLAMLLNKLMVWCCGCIIGRNASFGPRFVLIHSLGVVINTNVQGGEDIYIEHQVTIGAEKNASPNIGNDVFVGAGAKLIGPIRVGNHVRIGANAVVCKDVPDYATAIGVPARNVLPQDQQTSSP